MIPQFLASHPWIATHKGLCAAFLSIGGWIGISFLACFLVARNAIEAPAEEPIEDCFDGTCDHQHSGPREWHQP